MGATNSIGHLDALHEAQYLLMPARNFPDCVCPFQVERIGIARGQTQTRAARSGLGIETITFLFGRLAAAESRVERYTT